jgi:hypothetical protein
MHEVMDDLRAKFFYRAGYPQRVEIPERSQSSLFHDPDGNVLSVTEF